MRVIEQINASLRRFLAGDDQAHIVGEDVLDPYGGAFKASAGLSSEFPGRVITTPISEAAITGFATGMALKGKPVCLEIMFGDFITLSTDQIVNHMAKLPWVYDNQIEVPVVVRAPMGGKRGYGATHSQSLEKHFCGVPGLTVRAISQYSDIEGIFAEAFAARTPHLIVENKTSYARELQQVDLEPHERPDLVLVTYGGSTEVCAKAAEILDEEEELAVNVVEITRLWPFDADDLRRRTRDARRVLVVEEGSAGWGLASEAARALIGRRDLAFDAISAPDHPIPSARDWEEALLPNVDAVVRRAVEFVEVVA